MPPEDIEAKFGSGQDDLERLAAILNASGEYRVQKMLRPRHFVNPPDDSLTRTALFIDLETTGLDPASDEVIEVAMVPFRYGVDGRIFDIGDAYQSFNEPKVPIPDAVTRITGITNQMVAGHKLELGKIDALAADASLIIAHNASFDRRFAEKISSAFEHAAWACSMTQIDWAAEGHEGTKLAYLASTHGFFYERHRAEHDCYAAIELLTRHLPVSGRLAMAVMLEMARKPSWRIWAENSPYDLKDVLKKRGYRWNGEANGWPRAWYVDVDDELRDEELNFLRREIYLREVELFVQKITAYNRFSGRA